MAQEKIEIDFNLDAFKSDSEQRPFIVSFGGKEFALTHLDKLNGWEAAEAFAGGSAGADVEVVRLALGEKFLEFKNAASLNRGGLQALVKRYLAHCGIDAGN